MQILHLLKPALFLVAGCTMVFMAQQELRTHWREKQPTAYRAGEFASAYRGERWLSITGKLRFDTMWHRHGKDANPSPRAHHRVRVAMVDPQAPQDAPVPVVWSCGPFESEAQLAAWRAKLEAQPVQTLTGLRRPLSIGGVRSDLFPTLNVSSAVGINEGQSPKGGAGYWFLLGLGAVIIALSGRALAMLVRQRF